MRGEAPVHDISSLREGERERHTHGEREMQTGEYTVKNENIGTKSNRTPKPNQIKSDETRSKPKPNQTKTDPAKPKTKPTKPEKNSKL